MKSISVVLILMLPFTLSCAQNNKTRVIEKFIADLKNNKVSNEDLIVNYYQSDSQEVLLSIVPKQLELLRGKLVDDCSEIKVEKHDNTSILIMSFKLKTEGLNTANIFYIICNDVIITPVLIDGEKIKSISTYSKTETGPKNFVIF